MMDAPFECREIQDYYELGCCIYEVITKERASSSNENFKEFVDNIKNGEIPSAQIWRDYSPGAIEFIYMLLVLLPDRSYKVKDIIAHDFLITPVEKNDADAV